MSDSNHWRRMGFRECYEVSDNYNSVLQLNIGGTFVLVSPVQIFKGMCPLSHSDQRTWSLGGATIDDRMPGIIFKI